MTNGVMYFLCGTGFAELLAVSLHTLRQHFHGPVCVMVTDNDCARAIARIGTDPRMQPLEAKRCPLAKVKRHAPYVTKPSLPFLSPFDRTIYLDADTLVCGPLDELFDAGPLVMTRFSNWSTCGGKIISGRVRQWVGVVSPAATRLAQKQLEEDWPAINTGVFAFHRDHVADWCSQWNTLTLAGWERSLTDEIAAQLLQPLWQEYLRVLSDEWNWSPRYGIAPRDQVRVIHLHGRGHFRKREGELIWWPILREAMTANSGKLAEWAGEYDPRIRDRLGSLAV